ncbi:hypothetical protein LJC06_03195 [Bacteroidales bacterium OttesenSCG-928-I14]|nr:hypothetical protein [Bacteroidales bacterium OttesenSCG-928-I14]
MQIVKKYWTYLVGILLGGAGGYLYWRYIGCSTGACPITSSPIMSTLYGMLIGSLLGGTVKVKPKNNKE